MMLQSLARGTMLRRSIAAISATRSAALAASTMTRAMGSVTYSPPAAKIGKPAPDFTAVCATVIAAYTIACFETLCKLAA